MNRTALAFATALLLAIGCGGSSKPTAEPTAEPAVAAEPVAAAPSATPWTCYQLTDPGGNPSAGCFADPAECDYMHVESKKMFPDVEHQPCAQFASAHCFNADVLDEGGAVAMPAAPYCFLEATECEATRQIALADPQSARVAAGCDQR